MLRRAIPVLTGLTLLVAGALPVAWAAAGRLQQARVRRLKACVGIIPTGVEPTPAAAPANPFAGATADPDAAVLPRSPNPNPFLFWVLDQRKDLKPDGWEISNPAAPAFTTAAHSLRYGVPQGTPLRQDMAPYWELPLKPENYDRLAQMDVIYIPIGRAALGQPVATFFMEEQRQLMARLADAGVTLWVDWAVPARTIDGALGGNENTANPTGRTKNGFFTNLDFALRNGVAGPVAVGHPLLDSQFVFQAGDSAEIGSLYPGATQPSQNRAVEVRALDLQPTAAFTAVVPLNGVPPQVGAYVAAARFGAGFVVATAGNVGRAISGPAPGLRFTGDVGTAELVDLKFAYNLFAWRGEVSAQQKNGRHTGQGSVQVSGLIQRATYPDLVRGGGGFWRPYEPNPTAGTAANFVNPASPLIVNGVVIAASRFVDTQGRPQSEINAFAVDPNDDFDGNGFVDDGRTGNADVNASTPATDPAVDFSIGQSYDRLTSLPVPPIYGMALGEVPDPATGPLAQGGRTHIFAAGEAIGNFTGLYSLPAPRPGLLSRDNFATAIPAPNPLNIDYRGAPAFANIPGLSTFPISRLYAGGQASAAFGSSSQGKVVALGVLPDGTFARIDDRNNLVTTPEWYYPPNQEAARMGAVSGPVVTAQMYDFGTGTVDTMVFVTSVASGDVSGAQAGPAAGDTTGKVDGFIVATRGDVLTFPQGQNVPGGVNPAAGRQFVSARWVNVAPGVGQVPQQNELLWDPRKYFEVRVIDKRSGYVAARFVPSMLDATNRGFSLLRNGAAGQVQLPEPTQANGLLQFALPNPSNDPRLPPTWNLNDYVLVADYSPLPIAVDGTGATLRPRFSPATPYSRQTNPNQPQPTGIAGGVSVGKDGLVYYGTGQGYMCAAEWRKGRALFRWKMRGLEYQDQTGLRGQVNLTDPANHLPDYAFVAAPAAGDRIVFAAKGRAGTGPGTLYIIEPNATLRFRLEPSVTAAGQPVANFQFSPSRALDVMLEADHGVAVPQNNPGLLASSQPWGRVPNQFVVDPDTKTVTFLNMENFSLDLSRAVPPAQLLALGIDTGGRPAVPIRWGIRNGRPPAEPVLDAGGTNAWTAYVPLPVIAVYRGNNGEQWLSGPVISGDKVLAMSHRGTLHQLPLDPKTLLSSFPAPGAANVNPLDLAGGMNLGNTAFYGGVNGLARVKNVSDLGANVISATASPAVADGMVATSTMRGLTMYGMPGVLIADSNRIVEASGDSTALAVTDVVVKERADASEFPFPTDQQGDTVNIGTAQNPVIRPLIRERKLLSRLAMVRKLNRSSSLTAIFASSSPLLPPVDGPGGVAETVDWAEDSYLAADTGNNRAVEFNLAGKVIWELDSFQDPLGLLPAGEPLKLSGPMDVQRWVEQELLPGNLGTLFVIHTLIADTGNTRVIEIVDKVQYQRGQYTQSSYPVVPGQVGADGQPIRWYHVLVWTSQTNAQGMKLRYRTAQRVFWQDATGGIIPTNAANPGRAVAPFWLPPERFLGYTMCSVTGQQVVYPEGSGAPSLLQNYNRFWPATTTAVDDRKPVVRPGGDSIVFLRGYWALDERSPAQPRVTALREARVGGSAASDNYRFGQGIVDPNVPVLTEIWDEVLPSGPIPRAAPLPQAPDPIHRLNGIGSVQRTVRADVKFQPEGYGNQVMPRGMYFLIADSDGVWECRLLPGQQTPAPALPSHPRQQLRLAWSLNADDYDFITGGRRFSPVSARRFPNGLVLIASRTTANDSAAANLGYLGPDVFLLRAGDYRTALERQASGLPVPYDPRNNRILVPPQNNHGWQRDAYVPPPSALAPSIVWRAAEQLNPGARPGQRPALDPNPLLFNPVELTGSYVPVQPNYAELVF